MQPDFHLINLDVFYLIFLKPKINKFKEPIIYQRFNNMIQMKYILKLLKNSRHLRILKKFQFLPEKKVKIRCILF